METPVATPEAAGPVPMRLKDMDPNTISAGKLIDAMGALQELSLMRPASGISIQVFLAFDDLQRLYDASMKGLNKAKDKLAVLETELELPFQPFEIEKFTGDSLSPAGFTKLKGWMVTRGASKVKLPVFPDETAAD